jgi:hypothetical protein
MPQIGLPELIILVFIAPPFILLFFAVRWLLRVRSGAGREDQPHNDR